MNTPTRSCDLIGIDVDPAAWLPQDPLSKNGFDTNADLLQVTPNFLDQAVAAARALALEAVGDPKAAPIDTTYGNVANMIISLNPRPGTGTGNQEKYQDGHALRHAWRHGRRTLVRR